MLNPNSGLLSDCTIQKNLNHSWSLDRKIVKESLLNIQKEGSVKTGLLLQALSCIFGCRPLNNKVINPHEKWACYSSAHSLSFQATAALGFFFVETFQKYPNTGKCWYFKISLSHDFAAVPKHRRGQTAINFSYLT